MVSFCIITSLLSACIQLFKNHMANESLKRKGYNISNDNRSKSEIISSFIKDYFYILVPGVNVYKSFKLFMKDDNNYAFERKNKLEKYERLSQIKKDNIEKKESIKDILKKKFDEGTKKNIDNSKSIKIKNNIKENKSNKKNEINELIDSINTCNNINYLLNLKKIYREKASKLRLEYQKKKDYATNDELKLIIQKVKIYDNVFITCRDKLRQLNSENKKSL